MKLRLYKPNEVPGGIRPGDIVLNTDHPAKWFVVDGMDKDGTLFVRSDDCEVETYFTIDQIDHVERWE